MKHRDINKVKVGDLWFVDDYIHTFTEVSEDKVTYYNDFLDENVTWTKKMAHGMMNYNNGSMWNKSYFSSPDGVE